MPFSILCMSDAHFQNQILIFLFKPVSAHYFPHLTAKLSFYLLRPKAWSYPYVLSLLYPITN